MAYIDNVTNILQIQPDGLPTFVRLSQNENGRNLYFQLAGNEIDIPANATITISGTKPDGTVYSGTGSISDNVILIPEMIQMTAVAGYWDAKVKIISGGNTIATGRIRFVIDADTVDPDSVPSDSELEGLVAEAQQYAETARTEAYGSPLTAQTVAGMTDHTRVYVYTGSESGYTAGHWYFWNGSAWTDGGIYNSTAVNTDTTLTLAGVAADAKATGDAIEAARVAIDDTLTNEGEAADAAAVGSEISGLKEDLSALTDRVDSIEEEEGLHRYGVSGIGQSASQLTRLWDAVGMTAQVGTDGDNSGVINNFDDVTPFNRRKCVGTWRKSGGRNVFHVHAYLGDDDYTEDGTNGDYVAVECPRAYYYYKDGVLGVSAHQYLGWRPFDIFCHNHDPEDTMPYYYMPAYALALDESGHAVCLPGYDNEQGNYKQLVDAARTYQAGALGMDAIIMPMAMNFYEWALFTVEFARQDCQQIMQGCCDLRHNSEDRVAFIDATHVITNNYYATRVPMECIWIGATNIDTSHSEYKATHRIVSVTRCDASGNPDNSGTHQLLELLNLGKNYTEYDYTGATEYRIGARPYRTGDCNGVSTPSGSPVSNTNGYYPCKYRWHENPYSNQFHTVMDMFNYRIGTDDDDYYLAWCYLPDPSAYEPSTTSKPDATDLETDVFELLDIQTEHENYVNGYIKSKKHSVEYPDLWIPYETTGASGSTYYADYAYLVNSYVVRALRLSGSWFLGAPVGFSNPNANNAPSIGYAFYGGDLCIIQ